MFPKFVDTPQKHGLKGKLVGLRESTGCEVNAQIVSDCLTYFFDEASAIQSKALLQVEQVEDSLFNIWQHLEFW